MGRFVQVCSCAGFGLWLEFPRSGKTQAESASSLAQICSRLSGPNLFSLAKARNAGNRGSHGGIAYEFRGMANFEEASQASIIGGPDLRSCGCGAGVARTKVCKAMHSRPNSDPARKLGLY